MKLINIHIIIMLMALAIAPCFAQSTGGCGSGNAMAEVLNIPFSLNIASIYKGSCGRGDTMAQALNVPFSTAFAPIYSGGCGRGDTMAQALNVPFTTGVASIYAGGCGRGDTMAQALGITFSTGTASIYKGGCGRGDTMAQALNIPFSTTFASIYTGGCGRGDVMAQTLDLPFGVYLVLRVDIIALLGGPYQSGTGQMHDKLRNAGFIPLTEPYGCCFTGYPPGGGETIDSSVLQVAGSDAIVDWVRIELRDKTTNGVVVASRHALIQRDGDIVDVDGISPVAFEGVTADDYYVAVRHLNHLGVMTASVMTLSNTPLTIDFTDPVTSTYGLSAAQDTAADGKMVMWPGEVFQDGVIKYSGIDNDRDPVLQAIGGVVPTNTVLGYTPHDVNRDGIVKYSGADNDRDIILQTIGGVVPTNVVIEQLPE